jgi:hypothetical protein
MVFARCMGRALAVGVCLLAQPVLAGEPQHAASAAFPPLPEASAVARYDEHVGTMALARSDDASGAQFPGEVPTAAFTRLPEVSTDRARAVRVAPAPPPVTRWTSSPVATTPHPLATAPRSPVEDAASPTKPANDWMVSVEGVTHAPIDIGVQAGIELPARLRLFGGYGWVPSAYLDLMTSAASVAAGSDTHAALLSQGLQRGTTWRIQAGIRPFSRSGVYLDAGYSEVRLGGSVDGASLGQSLALDSLAVETTLRMWLVELGYQTDIGGRVVLGIAIGAMGTLGATTTVTPTPAAAEEAAAEVDELLETYGTVPTLTLRLGLDLV